MGGEEKNTFVSTATSEKVSGLRTARDALSMEGISVASFRGAAYDLWLECNMPSGATHVRADNWQDSVELVRPDSVMTSGLASH